MDGELQKMTKKQALKILDEALALYRIQYQWSAGAYKAGSRADFAIKGHNKLKGIETLTGPVQLELL